MGQWAWRREAEFMATLLPWSLRVYKSSSVSQRALDCDWEIQEQQSIKLFSIKTKAMVLFPIVRPESSIQMPSLFQKDHWHTHE